MSKSQRFPSEGHRGSALSISRRGSVRGFSGETQDSPTSMPLDLNALGPDSPVSVSSRASKKANGHGHKSKGSVNGVNGHHAQAPPGLSLNGGGTKIDMQTLFASVPSTPAIAPPPVPTQEVGRWAAGTFPAGLTRESFLGTIAHRLLVSSHSLRHDSLN